LLSFFNLLVQIEGHLQIIGVRRMSKIYDPLSKFR
jgi:hypothetical protein